MSYNCFSSLYLVLALILLQQPSWGATELCGILTVPTNLVLSASPYRLTGDLYVAPSARLTIEAGVEILVASGESCGETRQLDWSDSQFVSIKVDGSFFIHGSPSQPVRIRPENPILGKIQWDGIRLWGRNRITTQIQYAEISGANRALWALGSSFHVANCIFLDNNTAIHMEERSDLSIYNNLFVQQVSTGLYIEKSTPNIFANIFYRNAMHGIWSDSRPRIPMRHNLFFGNGDLPCKGCPAGAGKLAQVNALGDSVDTFNNLYSDPFFLDSPTEKLRRTKDPLVATPASASRDSLLHKTYHTADSAGKAGLPLRPEFQAKGRAPWMLSRYSPALDAAPPSNFFKDVDGSPGDVGPFGGVPDRVRLKSPF